MSDFTETDTYAPIAQALQDRLDDRYRCVVDADVEYDLHYTPELETETRTFSTDLTIFENSVPRAIIEVKRGAASTHQLMHYDTKAERHKRVYPSLRYGMLIVEGDRKLTKKYLWHSDILDFFYVSEHEMTAPDEFLPSDLDEFTAVLERNLDISNTLDDILTDEHRPHILHNDIQFTAPE